MPSGSILTALVRTGRTQLAALASIARRFQRLIDFHPLDHSVLQRDRQPSSSTLLGFLTVLEHDVHGLTGGYLLLTMLGRPVEFHCTAPVKPSRAQQILFGPTLAPFLYGEHIGQTLASKGSVQPLAIFTDVAPALALGQLVECPVLLVLKHGVAGQSCERSGLSTFEVGRNHLAAAAGTRHEQVAHELQSLAEFDCSEPFDRIRAAIEEAQRGSAKAA